MEIPQLSALDAGGPYKAELVGEKHNLWAVMDRLGTNVSVFNGSGRTLGGEQEARRAAHLFNTGEYILPTDFYVYDPREVVSGR